MQPVRVEVEEAEDDSGFIRGSRIVRWLCDHYSMQQVVMPQDWAIPEAMRYLTTKWIHNWRQTALCDCELPEMLEGQKV